MIRIIFYLKDGRTLSGTYGYLSVLSQLAFARDLPEYEGFDIVGAV